MRAAAAAGVSLLMSDQLQAEAFALGVGFAAPHQRQRLPLGRGFPVVLYNIAHRLLSALAAFSIEFHLELIQNHFKIAFTALFLLRVQLFFKEFV